MLQPSRIATSRIQKSLDFRSTLTQKYRGGGRGGTKKREKGVDLVRSFFNSLWKDVFSIVNVFTRPREGKRRRRGVGLAGST